MLTQEPLELPELPACTVAKPSTAPTQSERAHPPPIHDDDTLDKGRDAGSGTVATRTIKVKAFDCERRESFPGVPPQSGLVVHGYAGGTPVGRREPTGTSTTFGA